MWIDGSINLIIYHLVWKKGQKNSWHFFSTWKKNKLKQAGTKEKLQKDSRFFFFFMPVWKSAFQRNPADSSVVKPAGPVDGSRRVPHLLLCSSLIIRRPRLFKTSAPDSLLRRSYKYEWSLLSSIEHVLPILGKKQKMRKLILLTFLWIKWKEWKIIFLAQGLMSQTQAVYSI